MQGDKYVGVAKPLIASVRRVMPDVEIFQLTDGKTQGYPGIGTIRLDDNVPMAVRRMLLHASLPGEWLFVDTDVVIQKDVRHVFESDFDIAVTDRVGSAWEHSPDCVGMPYNMGVTFSRRPEFWAACAEKLKTLPAKLQQWEGDQRVVCSLAKDWKTKVLPGLVYNFTPYTKDEDRSHAAICHYKGARKAWLADHH